MRVAAEVGVVDVEEVVLRVARAEGDGQKAVLPSLSHLGADVEERSGDGAVAHELDPPGLLDDVEGRRVTGRRRDVDRLVEAGRDRHEGGRSRTRRERAREHDQQSPTIVATRSHATSV